MDQSNEGQPTNKPDLSHRFPWRLEIDPDIEPALEPGVRYCRVRGPGKFDTIVGGWDHPQIFTLIAAAPQMIDALRTAERELRRAAQSEPQASVALGAVLAAIDAATAVSGAA